jgi:hypothetical protein
MLAPVALRAASEVDAQRHGRPQAQAVERPIVYRDD